MFLAGARGYGPRGGMVSERRYGPREGDMVPGGYGPRQREDGLRVWHTLPLPVLTSSGGHQSGWYASYCNAFLLRLIAVYRFIMHT